MKNKTLIHGGLFSIFSFFNRGISFLLLILLANYITPQEYGELSLFNTMVTFLGYFIGLSTAGYLSISFFQTDNDNFKKDFSTICIITILSSLLLSFLFLLFNNWLSNCFRIDTIYLFIAIAIAFSNVFVQLNLDYIRVQEKVSFYGLLSCSFALLNFILSLYLVVRMELSWLGRVYAQLSCDLLFMLIALGWFYKDKLFKLTAEISRYKEILLWGIPLIPHLASVWIKQGCDRYIIESNHTMADVGIFSFALNLTGVIIMIGSAFNNTCSVSLYNTLSSTLTVTEKLYKLHQQEKIITYVYFVAFIIITILGVIFIPLLVPEYSASVLYFFILSFSGLVNCLYFLYCNYLFYFKKTKKLMYITFCTSLLHLLLSLIFTPYSLIFTSMIYIISISVVVLFVRKESKVLLQQIK